MRIPIDVEVRDTIFNALRSGMKIVKYDLLNSRKGLVETKPDGSPVTQTDTRAEIEIMEELSGLDDFRFQGEEGTSEGTGERTIICDPLDGTRAFMVGAATSTVIIAIINAEGQVEFVAIGDPATERIWWADQEDKTVCVTGDGEGEESIPCQVQDGSLSPYSVVFLDRNVGHHGTMTDEQMSRFMVAISKRSRILMLGSNGMHQALVANGGAFAAAQITTGMSGPWDIAGVLLVLKAGGAAAASVSAMAC